MGKPSKQKMSRLIEVHILYMIPQITLLEYIYHWTRLRQKSLLGLLLCYHK